MVRMARVVLPGYPHHVTQRGNRRQTLFCNFGDSLLIPTRTGQVAYLI